MRARWTTPGALSRAPMPRWTGSRYLTIFERDLLPSRGAATFVAL